MTWVVRTLWISNSAQKPKSRVLIAAESASVSSVMFPIPIMIAASGKRARVCRYLPSELANPHPIGSRIGSNRNGILFSERKAAVSTIDVWKSAGSSGIATTSTPQFNASLRLLELTDKTSVAPLRTACSTSQGSNESIETPMPWSVISRTESATSDQRIPGSHPKSMRLAPCSIKR